MFYTRLSYGLWEARGTVYLQQDRVSVFYLHENVFDSELPEVSYYINNQIKSSSKWVNVKGSPRLCIFEKRL